MVSLCLSVCVSVCLSVCLSGLISPPFLDKIPPNLVCDQIILTARGTQAYFFDLGHVTFVRGQLPFMGIGPFSLELKKIMK